MIDILDKKIVYLKYNEVIFLHDEIIKETGGLKGIRDQGLLESALFAPQISLFGRDQYYGIYEKAAIYLYHIIKNHAFNDGNKRTAYGCVRLFFKINHKDFPHKEDWEKLCVMIADGSTSKEELLTIFNHNDAREGKCRAHFYV